MSYQRVIPRDLFNEANLLKCYGQLYIQLEPFFPYGVTLEHAGSEFLIRQNPDDGSLSITNIYLNIQGKRCILHRPLNSRSAWPLYLNTPGYEDLQVFTQGGDLSCDMRGLIKLEEL